MKSVEVERVLPGEPARVFELATDLRGAPGRMRAIRRLEVLTDGPVGLGTRFRETRVMFGKEASETMEFVAFEPPRRYALEARSHGSRYSTEFRFEPAAGGTRVVARFAAEPLTALVRVLAVLMGPMMKAACAKALQQDLADLERVLREEQAAAPQRS